ncbi:MAG: hypothetical protein ACK5KP_11990 [Paludibacteraceae bacterium]
MDSSTFRSYITVYYDYDDIDLSLSDNGNIAILGAEFDKHYMWKSKGHDKEIYDSLCISHNDMGYDKKRDYIVGTNWGHCSTFDIKSIDIKSNTAYDEQHLSGASLNDIVRFISVSPQKFIDSNYRITCDWDVNKYKVSNVLQEQRMANFINNSERMNYFPIDKKLSEIVGSDELRLLPDHYIGYLLFDSNPTVEKVHTFTVTVELSNGKTMSKSIEKTFD